MKPDDREGIRERIEALIGDPVALDQLQYLLLPYQDNVPITTPADLHLTRDSLTATLNDWGTLGWFFPDATAVKDESTVFPGQFGFRLRSNSAKSVALIAVRRIKPA